MHELLVVPNPMSTGRPNYSSSMLLAMPPTALSRRLVKIRELAGYADNAAKFARKIGITPASLHDLESGESKSLGKSLPGYLRLGANPHFILQGRGIPMLKDIEKHLWAQTIVMLMMQLDESQIKTVEEVVKAFAQSHAIVLPQEASGRDPAKDQ